MRLGSNLPGGTARRKCTFVHSKNFNRAVQIAIAAI
jgi:hypothetical protein